MSRPSFALRLSELEEIELAIDQLVEGGEGLGRFEGIPVFVPRTAPGDRVRVQLIERHTGYARGEIVELLVPGPGRREPPCPSFARCGGCDLQHLDDKLQVRLKVLAVAETLRRIAGFELPADALEIVSGDAWGWRLRCQLHLEPVGGGHAVGYHARRSRELVAVDECPVLVPELQALLPTLARQMPAEGAPRRLDLTAADDGQLSVAPVVPGLPQGEVTMRVGRFEYRFDARCFFQGHRGLLPELVTRVVGTWEGETAFDLYGGVGLFALPLARHYRNVVLVEGDRIAARFARLNFRANPTARLVAPGSGGESRHEVVAQAVESWIGTGLPADADRVIVDPPRSGLSPEVLATLLERRPRRLTYLSCHAAALARDLRRLLEVFDVERLVFLDLFPQTGHLEVLVQLFASARPSPVRLEPAAEPTRTPAEGESYLALERLERAKRAEARSRPSPPRRPSTGDREERGGRPRFSREGGGAKRAPFARRDTPARPRREFVIDGPPRPEGWTPPERPSRPDRPDRGAGQGAAGQGARRFSPGRPQGAGQGASRLSPGRPAGQGASRFSPGRPPGAGRPPRPGAPRGPGRPTPGGAPGGRPSGRGPSPRPSRPDRPRRPRRPNGDDEPPES